MPQKETLHKSERLCSKKAIESLFAGGSKSTASFPFRAVYKEAENSYTPLRIMISIPKHRLHHATDRNRMKRLVREAYRREKPELYERLHKSSLYIDVAFICISDKVADYPTVRKSIRKILQKISEFTDKILENRPSDTNDTIL
jgi:ribonuclease P protein component